jgi:hypothetical protein
MDAQLMNRFISATALIAVLSASGSAWALKEDLRFDGSIMQSWDDNQSQAQFDRDKVEDNALQVNGNLGWEKTIFSRSLIVLSGFAEYEMMDEVSPLDRLSIGLKGVYRWQPSSAFTAPLIEFNLSYQDDDYDEDSRDSGVLQSQLFVTRRLTDRITATAGLQYRKRDSAGSVWDLEDYRLFINGDYLLNQSAALYVTYSYNDGDTFSSAQRSFCNGASATDILPLIDAATAVEADQAYNDTFCGDWLAYRIDAQAHIGVAGVNYALSHNTSLDFSIVQASVVESNEREVEYDRRLIRASIMRRF